MFEERNGESWAINFDNICEVLRKISDKTITTWQVIRLNCNLIRPELIAPNDFFRDDYLQVLQK
jgi:hypothetical protein